MKRVKNCIFFIFFFCLAYLSSSVFNQTYAAKIIFEDNFDDGNLNKWDIINQKQPNPCSAIWNPVDKMLKISINESTCGTNIMPNDISWSQLSNNYMFEVDMTFVNGTDHNLIIYINPSTLSGYELHFQSPNDFTINVDNSYYDTIVRGNYPNGNTYHIKTMVEKKKIQVYINDLLVRGITFPDELPPGKIGLRAGVGSDTSSETWFDNVKVTSLDPEETNLDVPLLKQTTEPWGSQVYDAANVWNPLHPTINDWGCALTSAAMVLNYHGYKKLPDGTTLDPGTLNNWLKSQADGYVGGGLVNWLSMTRLSKLAKTVNDITKFDGLEFFRVNGEEKEILKMDINNSNPDILEEPGHFIVAKGISGDTFNINDPYYDRLTLNDGYSNTFLSMETFIPSSTDLSYLMLVTDQNTQITLKDSLNNEIGDQFVQNLINDNNPSLNTPTSKILYFRKPDNGDYKIYVSSSSLKYYNLDVFLYDQDANFNKITQKGVVGPKNTDVIQINFDKTNFNNSFSKKIVTFKSTISDIHLLKNLKLIKNNIFADLLAVNIKLAQKQYKLKQNKAYLMTLNIFEFLINKTRGKEIDEKAYQILLYDFQALRGLIK